MAPNSSPDLLESSNTMTTTDSASDHYGSVSPPTPTDSPSSSFRHHHQHHHHHHHSFAQISRHDSMTVLERKLHLEPTHEGEYHADTGESGPIVVTSSTYLFAFCAALNSCNLGYDIGVNTDAGRMIQGSMDLSDERLEAFMGGLNLFATLGALFSNVVCDRFGRRSSFAFASGLFVLGVVIQSTAVSYEVLMTGRIFVGLGVGFGLAIDPLYISEISPASHRGALVTWSEIATNVGIVLGFSSGAIFRNVEEDVAWRYMFAMGGILPAIIILLAAFVMPESPRWLASRGRVEEARRVLERVYPPHYNVDAILYEIHESIDREHEAEHSTSWTTVLFFPTPAFRRMLLVGVGTAISQQIVGIDAVQYFLVYILNEAGITGRGEVNGVLIGLGLLKLGCIFIAGRLFDRRGRRPLFFASLFGMTVAVLLLSACFFSAPGAADAGTVAATDGGDDDDADEPPPGVSAPTVAVFALALYLASFSVGMGPGAWLIPSEVFSTSIRAKSMSIATFLNRIAGTVMSSTLLSAADALSWGGYFLFLGGVCLCVAAFLYVYLPETKGRSLEDMSVYFAELTGDRSVLEAEAKLRHEDHEDDGGDDDEDTEQDEEGIEVNEETRLVPAR